MFLLFQLLNSHSVSTNGRLLTTVRGVIRKLVAHMVKEINPTTVEEINNLSKELTKIIIMDNKEIQVTKDMEIKMVELLTKEIMDITIMGKM